MQYLDNYQNFRKSYFNMYSVPFFNIKPLNGYKTLKPNLIVVDAKSCRFVDTELTFLILYVSMEHSVDIFIPMYNA